MWSIKHKKCKKCGLTTVKHKGNGLCRRCFLSIYWKQYKAKMDADPILKTKFLHRRRLADKKRVANPITYKRRMARQKLYNTLIAGKIKRPESCSIENCNNPAQAHHPNYSKPLEVIWLCQSHHTDLHFLI
jgi:hypothetical protein